MQPLQRLLTDIVDYAGLFPPAALDIETTAANLNTYQACGESWMLARVVVPLARLSDFEAACPQSLTHARISLLPPPLHDAAFADAMERVAEFNASQTRLIIDAIEVRTSDATSVPNASAVPAGVKCFVEVPAALQETLIPAIADLGRPKDVFAKMRTGGVEPEMIPESETVADFMLGCLQAGIGFKATAGLHHPFRAEYPLTYEPGCDSGRMHGFMNVFLGACFLHTHRISKGELIEFLDQETPEQLTITPESIEWRDYKLNAKAIAAARETFIISFGSCSFTEPVEDLKSLSLLPENPDAAN